MSNKTIDELLASRSVVEDQAAVVSMGRNSMDILSREALLLRAGRLAGGLRDAGLERGGRVVILAPNSADWLISALGVMNAGGVVVPLDTQMPREDLEYALSDCDPEFIFTISSLKKRLPESQRKARIRLFDVGSDGSEHWADLLAKQPASPAAGPDDTAAIFYTSGTTGPPKGVPLTHHNLTSNAEAVISLELADNTDRFLVPLPFHHVYPFAVGILIPLTLGAPIVVPFSLVGPQIVRALRDGEVTILVGVPRLYKAIWSALQERVASRGRMVSALFRQLLLLSVFARAPRSTPRPTPVWCPTSSHSTQVATHHFRWGAAGS